MAIESQSVRQIPNALNLKPQSYLRAVPLVFLSPLLLTPCISAPPHIHTRFSHSLKTASRHATESIDPGVTHLMAADASFKRQSSDTRTPGLIKARIRQISMRDTVALTALAWLPPALCTVPQELHSNTSANPYEPQLWRGGPWGKRNGGSEGGQRKGGGMRLNWTQR